MPDGAHIDLADTLAHEPLVFATPWGARPDAAPPERRQPLDHPNGAAEITRVHLTRPRGTSLSAAAAALERSGVVTFAESDAYLAALELDDARAGRSLDLRPALPLVVRA